jgi:hypothetical protein
MHKSLGRAAALLLTLSLLAPAAHAQNRALDLAQDKTTDLHPTLREGLDTLGPLRRQRQPAGQCRCRQPPERSADRPPGCCRRHRPAVASLATTRSRSLRNCGKAVATNRLHRPAGCQHPRTAKTGAVAGADHHAARTGRSALRARRGDDHRDGQGTDRSRQPRHLPRADRTRRGHALQPEPAAREEGGPAMKPHLRALLLASLAAAPSRWPLPRRREQAPGQPRRAP